MYLEMKIRNPASIANGNAPLMYPTIGLPPGSGNGPVASAGPAKASVGAAPPPSSSSQSLLAMKAPGEPKQLYSIYGLKVPVKLASRTENFEFSPRSLSTSKLGEQKDEETRLTESSGVQVPGKSNQDRILLLDEYLILE